MSVESYIQVPPDSTGKRIRSIQKTIGGIAVQEEVFVPSSTRTLIGAYAYSSPVVAGSTTSGYVYHSFFYPSTATNLVAVRRIWISWVAAGSAAYIEGALYRITSASGGTARSVSLVSKKDTNYPDPTIDLRDTGVTVTLAQKVFNFITPGAAGQMTGIWDLHFVRPDGRSDIILRPGQGLCLRQEAAGNANFRVSYTIEWEEFTGVTVT
jgi:hypothetical protein